jgi:outer membrane biosynthesis protein TonB
MTDRSKYRKASEKEMAQQQEAMAVRSENNSDRATFLKVEPGINKFRVFPAPLKAESSLFCFPKVTSFLPLLVDKYEDGKKTGEQEVKRRAVFNAKVHGGLEIDIVEAYIEAAKEKFSALCKDKKELYKKLTPLTDWKTGIKPSSAYICYAIKYTGDGKNKQYGRLQLTDGVKKQLDSLCLREGKSGAPIVVDLFSDPDSGKPFQWNSNPNAEDAKARNKINILFEEDFPLTDEELEMLESWDSLESLYINSYKKSDFEKQVKGLQRFDKDNKLNIFESPAFQSILESAKAEVEEKLADDEEESTDENEEQEEKQPAKKATPKKKEEPAEEKKEDEDTIPEILEEMDKKTLMSIPGILEIEVEGIKTTTPPSKMRRLIKDAMVAVYELEGDNEEINSQITDILLDSMPASDAEETEEQEQEQQPKEEQKEETAPKKGSLLDKYRKK